MNARVILKSTAWGLVALLLAVSVGAAAQEDIITAGETVAGTINDDNYFDIWRYISEGGESITVEVEATSGDLDAALAIFTNALDVFGMSEDINAAGGNYNAGVRDLHIPHADTVLIFVSRFDGEDGTSSGDYHLRLTRRVDVATEQADGPERLHLDADAIQTGPEAAWNHLMKRAVVPKWHGRMGINRPEGLYLEGSEDDDSFLLFKKLQADYKAADVIIHASLTWRGASDTLACGLIFRTQGDYEAYGVFLGRGGWIDLGFFRAGEGEETKWESLGLWDVAELHTRDRSTNNLLVTAVGDEFNVFVNYVLVATAADDHIAEAGEFYVAMLKGQSEQVRCEFDDYWAISIYP